MTGLDGYEAPSEQIADLFTDETDDPVAKAEERRLHVMKATGAL